MDDLKWCFATIRYLFDYICGYSLGINAAKCVDENK